MQYPLDSNLQYCYCNGMSKEVRGDPRGFIARVEAAREERGLQVYEFSEAIGQAGSYWSSWMNRHRVRETFPRGDTLAAMAEVLQVPIAHLLGIRQGASQGQVIAERRAPYLSDAALLRKVGAEPVSDDLVILEEFAMSAANGRGNLIPQNYDDMRELRRKAKARRGPNKEQTIYILRVSGTCMTGTLNDGDMVWLDTTLDRTPPAIVLAVKGEHEAHIKRLVEHNGKRYLEADDGWSAPLDDDWRIVARAYKVQRALA
jgi:transcriptional regulator with XRE-family HTH domain